MRFLLRDLDTGEFYKAPDLWVRSSGEATNFPDVERAREERDHIPRPHLEMIAVDKSDTTQFNVRLWRAVPKANA
jgi:hypothetical protein